MKKTLLTVCAVGASLFASSTSLAAGSVGVGASLLNIRGGFEYSFWNQDYEVNGVSDGKDSSGYVGSISISPRTRILPNMRAATTEVNGNALEYSKNDFSLYYNPLRTRYGQLSVGGGVSQVQGTSKWAGEHKNLDDMVGHFYGAFEIGSKATFGRLFGQGFFGSGQLDYKIGWKYPFKLGPLGLELQAGYRSLEIDFENFGDLNVPAESTVSGFFAGGSLYLF
ncbi:hypothetical protein [Vibrio owensii]|uniref:Outer membrane protein beta-barrel domain-containing protein n=1 Tax=Vibrio owensii CAIM 1854 = LMG 25443 TaxID=1229493 RepID=A0A0C1W9K4_9VIBR|nr:hypothetical protein [Vibrio owensii]KIF53032.1 hypothetical protein H735_08770 [Vibrio owensii CAIM 1854 = LMG 25443]